MANPFVISAKFTLDGSNVNASAGAIRQEFGKIGVEMDAVGQKAASFQTALNGRLGIQDNAGTNRGADIEAYGRQLDELRARFNPLFALEQRRAASLAEINRAHSLGAISAREMTAAVRAEEAAFTRSVAAINNSTDALQHRNQVMAANGNGQFATANVAAQFQDIAVTSAMGMSPLQIALQQGTQISAAFGNMGAAGAVKTLGAAFVSIISPVSLVTIGLVAGAAAAIQFFAGLGNGSKNAAAALEEQQEAVEKLLAGYEAARQAGDDVVEGRAKRPEAAVMSDLSVFREKAAESYLTMLDAVIAKQTEFQELVDLGAQSGAPDELTAMLQRTLDVVTETGLGSETTATQLAALDTALTLIKNSGADDNVAYIAEELWALLQAAIEGKGRVDSLAASLDALDRDVQITLSIGTEFGSAMEDLQKLYVDPRSRFDVAREQASNSFDQAQATAQSYGQMVGAGEEYVRVLGSIDAAEADAEAKKTARASKEVSAFDRQLKTIQERTAAQQIETNVIGLGTYASERARMVLELENAAREDAIGLSSGRAAQIQEEASAYALAAASQEKAVEAQRLATEQVEFGRSTQRSFFADLKAGLKDGQDGWAALGNAGANALDRIADRALGMMSDGIFDAIFGAVMGGITGGGGGLFGGMGSGLGGVSSITGSGGGFFPGFADGGWTGGVAGQVRGAVHGEEFVVRAGPAAQHRQLLETLNSGGSLSLQGGGGVTNNYINAQGSRMSRAEFEAALDARDRRNAANAPTMLADARHRAAQGTN